MPLTSSTRHPPAGEDPSTSAPGPSNPAGPSTAPDASRNLDLVTDVLGVQVDGRASTIEWASGQRTVLPFLPKRTRNRRLRNLLENDARYATNLAKLPEAGPSSAVVAYLDKTTPKHDLFKAARNALSLNKTVVVPGYVDTESFDFTVEGLEEYFGISPHKPVQAHGTFRFPVSLTLD